MNPEPLIRNLRKMQKETWKMGAGDKKLLWRIFLFALFVRFVVVLTGVGYDRQMTFWDARDYDNHAIHLLKGLGFTNGVSFSSRPPLYPCLLAFTYLLFGHHYLPIRMLQSVLDALSILVVFAINQRFFRKRVCFLAALFCSAHLILVFYCGNILTETLSLFLLSFVVLTLLVCTENNSVGWGSVCGILFGLLLLTKSSLSPVFLVMAIWILGARSIRFPSRLKVMAAVTLCTVAAIAPWTIRNYKIHHAFVPLVTSAGSSLWDLNNPKAIEHPEIIGLQADWIMVGNVFKEEDGRRIRLSEVEGDRTLTRRALAFQKEFLPTKPRQFFLRLLRKFLAAWSFHPGQHPLEYMLFFFTYGLALGGFILSLKSRPRPLLHYFLILQYIAVAMMYYGRAKYRVPIEPYAVTFTAFSLDRIFSSSGTLPQKKNSAFKKLDTLVLKIAPRRSPPPV